MQPACRLLRLFCARQFVSGAQAGLGFRSSYNRPQKTVFHCVMKALIYNFDLMCRKLVILVPYIYDISM